MHVEQCRDCGKWVSHKPLLGTLHFCLSETERQRLAHARWMMEQQKRLCEHPQGLMAGFGLSHQCHAAPKIGRPRLEETGKTNEALKPWVKVGMSRATWYRRQREKADGQHR